MSNNETTYLKLIKPTAGATNWAGSMNNNLDTIDAKYAELQNTMESLFNSKDYLQSCIFTEKDEDYIYMVNGSVSYDQLIIGRMTYVNNNPQFESRITIGDENYNNFVNFRAFYVYCGNQNSSSYTPPTGVTTPPYNMDWKNGDICVITKKYVDGNFQVSFNKIPQVLGSKYLDLTRSVVELKDFTLRDGKYVANFTLNKGSSLVTISDKNFPNIVCNCYIGTGASSGRFWEKITIDYQITMFPNNNNILFEFYFDQDPTTIVSLALNQSIIAVISYGDNNS